MFPVYGEMRNRILSYCGRIRRGNHSERTDKEGTKQAERDKLKNHILEVYGLPLLRFATNGSGEKEKLAETIDQLLMPR